MLSTIIRQCVPPAHWQYISWYRDRFGRSAALSSYWSLLVSGDHLGRVRTPIAPSEIYVRPGTSDGTVFEEVFLQKAYDVPVSSRPSFIIDAGANIGMTSVFYASLYPEATIVSIEPEEGNFDVLLRNTKPYSRIHPIKAGLWSRRASLAIANPEADSWGYQVKETTEGTGIPALGVADIVADFGVERIDILKLDIEGGEIEVLKTAADWIDRVNVLIIELHDRFRPGCTEALEAALRGREFTRAVSGDCLVFTRVR